MAQTATNKKPLSTGMKVLIILLAVALVAGGVLLALKIKADKDEELRQSIINSGVLHPGITIAGVDVSNMSPDQAAEALKGAEEALVKDVALCITDGEHTYDFDITHFDITFDTKEVVAEAMTLGRSGDLETLQAEVADIALNGRSFELSYEAKPVDVEAFVANIAAELDTPATDATFSVKQLEMNEKTNALNVVNIGLTEEEVAAGADIRDKRFDFVEGVNGCFLDQEALVSAVNAAVENREYGDVYFELQPLYPSVTVATIKQSLVLRSIASTSFSRGNYDRPTRVHNMTKACGLVYATVMQPGDVFSCNDTLGPRYEKHGWQLAPAVIEGGANTEDQPGGGVCQVSTTMYNAVLMGDYEIVYRQAHSSRLSYVAGGLDATINTGTIDFKWSNNTEAPIYVFTWIDTEKQDVWCEIYGLPFSGDFDSIKLISEELPSIAPTADEFIPLASLTSPYWMLKNEAKKGYVYDTFKVYMMGEEEVRKEKITTTTYKMHPNRYYVWPGYMGGALLPEYRLALPEN